MTCLHQLENGHLGTVAGTGAQLDDAGVAAALTLFLGAVSADCYRGSSATVTSLPSSRISSRRSPLRSGMIRPFSPSSAGVTVSA